MGKLFLLSLLLFSYSSCTDKGCIEADDFGEYQQQILTIKANNVDENCNYNSTKSLDDASQGAGIKICLTAGNVTIDLDDNNTLTSSTGCIGFNNIVARNLCVEQCRQQCISGGSGDSSQAEPDWVSTTPKISGQNSGVIITPGAQIEIRVVGNVTLSEDEKLPSVFVRSSPTDYNLQSKKSDLTTDSFLDVVANSTKSIKFSGVWTDATDGGNSGNITVGGNMETAQQAAFNGARRLVAYVIPHPADYSFDINATSEKAGTKGTPLFADTDLWTCTYDNTDIIKQSSCSSLPYNTSTGYPTTNDATASTLYGITSSTRGNNLGTIGGSIRWNNDGLESFANDPFVSASCNPVCSNLPSDTSVGGILNSAGSNLGDPLNPVILSNNNSYAVRVSFKNLAANDNNVCNITLSISVQDRNSVAISQNDIAINKTDWNTSYLALEPGDKMTFATNSANYSSTNCGSVIAYRTNKLQDITINQSGFVSFTSLGISGSSGSCNLKGRIINPSGSRLDDSANNFDNDFYEYDSFSTSHSNDPLSGLNVQISNATFPNAPFIKNNWSNKVFVRKGQVIRLDPESWNGSWNPGTNHSRQCGVGMIMRIEQRPALLCRGVASDQVPNPQCHLASDPTTGDLICSRYAPECYDTTSNSYCPADGSDGNTNCQDNYNSSICAQSGPPAVTPTSCANCKSRKDANGLLSPTTGMDLLQCYDLENYKGKISNIPATTGFTANQLDDSGASKGAVKLTIFNGTYGNFDGFSDTGKKEVAAYNDNEIYSSAIPATFSYNGRLKFLILDGNNFKDIISSYGGNGGGSSSYDGLNGYKVDLSGKQEFKNGQWLQAILCQESTSTSHNCSSNAPVDVSGQPFVVKLAEPTSPDDTGHSITHYKFDPFGSILRFANSNATGPNPDDNPITNVPLGSNFYQHGYQYYPNYNGMSKDQIDDIKSSISKLRLTFKIKDPEVGSCIIASPVLNQDCSSVDCDGIVAQNPFYNSGTDTNNSAICTTTPGDICTNDSPPNCVDGCQKQFFCANKYYNNSGSYKVIVKVKNEQSNISDIVNQVVSPVIEIMDGRNPSNTVVNCKVSNPQLNQNCTGTTCDGLVSTNPFYYPDNSINANAICGTADAQPGSATNQCQKQYYCAPQAGFKIGQAERVYKAIINNPKFKAILEIMVIMMITFYGVGYLMGISEFSQGEIIARIIKIGVVYLFVSPTGWYWFNEIFVHFFKDGTDYITFIMASAFDRSSELQNAINSGDFHDKSILFSGIDKVFGMFFSSAVQKKISALLFASIFGWAYLYLIYLGFMLYVYAVANAVLLYLTAQVFISILFVLGPLFFLTLLFNQTKEMFDKWLSELIGFSLQQIFLLITLAFFNMMMYEVLKASLGYRICWDDVWVINIYITRIKLLSFWTIASLPPRLNPQSEVGNIGNPEGIPSIFSILFIWVIASLMNKFITFMTDLAAAIGGGVKASQMAEGISKAAQGVNSQMAGYRRKYFDQHARSALQSIDRALFDSGTKAKADRDKKKENDAKDIKNRSALDKAGNDGVSRFKADNALKLSKMTPEEQQKSIMAARNKAMNEKATALNLSPEEARRLIDNKSKLGTANTVSGLLKETWQKRNSLTKAIADKKIKTSLSGTESKAALAKLDDKGKAEFAQAVADNELQVKVTRTEKAKDTAITAGKFLKNDEEAYKTVAGAVGKTVDGIKNAPQNFKSATKNILDNIKAMPGKIGKSIKDSQDETAKTMEKNKQLKAKRREDQDAFWQDASQHKLKTAAKLAGGTIAGLAAAPAAPFVAASMAFDKLATSKAESEARKQLEEEGKITKMALGGRWAATDQDKKLIADRVKDNKEKEQKPATNKKSDIDFIKKAAGNINTTKPTAAAHSAGQTTEPEDDATDTDENEAIPSGDQAGNSPTSQNPVARGPAKKPATLAPRPQPSTAPQQDTPAPPEARETSAIDNSDSDDSDSDDSDSGSINQDETIAPSQNFNGNKEAEKLYNEMHDKLSQGETMGKQFKSVMENKDIPEALKEELLEKNMKNSREFLGDNLNNIAGTVGSGYAYDKTSDTIEKK